MASPAALEFRGVDKRFGYSYALRRVSCVVPPGAFVAVFGPNGAGKTTLTRLAATLARPSSGTVQVFGTELAAASASVRAQLGVVSHRSFLYGELTARENLSFFAQMFEVRGAAARVCEVAEQVGLGPRLDDPVRSFSRGLEQRCAIARALIHDPPLLLLDEPYSGLDPHAASNLTEVLREAHKAGRTVVMTSHDLAHGAELADTVGILHAGKVRYWDSPPDDLVRTFAQCTAGHPS